MQKKKRKERNQKNQKALKDSPAERSGPLVSAKAFGFYGQGILLDTVVMRLVIVLAVSRF